MIVGIISDTHDNARNMIDAFEIFKKKGVDIVFHLGDWVTPFMLRFCKGLKIISIFGNNEYERGRYPKKADSFGVDVKFIGQSGEIELDGKKFFLCHGHNDSELNLALGNYDIVLSGHNHTASITHGDSLHINPGSTSGIKYDDINHEKTIAIYNTKTDEAEIIRF